MLVSLSTRCGYPVTCTASRHADRPTAVLDKDVVGGAGTAERTIYSETKFIQLLGAHWWRRQLAGKCDVVAVSPGLIPNTGLGRNSSFKMSTDMPDAKTIPEG